MNFFISVFENTKDKVNNRKKRLINILFIDLFDFGGFYVNQYKDSEDFSRLPYINDYTVIM